MVSLNVLYYSLAIGFLILVGFLSYAAFNLSQTFRKSTSILKKVDDIAEDAEELKNFLKQGTIYLKDIFFKKGGDKHGKK